MYRVCKAIHLGSPDKARKESTHPCLDMSRSLSWRSQTVVRQLLCYGALLLCLLQPAGSQAPVNGKMYVPLGSGVIIKCRAENLLEVKEMTWQRTQRDQTKNFLTYTPGTGPTFLTLFGRRTKFLRDGSIAIHDVTLSDEGVYKQVITTFSSMAKEYKIYLEVQVFPDIHVFSAPDPVVGGCLEKTVATCIAGAAKPPAAISWRTGDLPFVVEENVTRHKNGTVTIKSGLKMTPERKINGHKITCVILQDYGLSDVLTKRTITLQNIHFPPQMVSIEVFRNADGSLRILCESEANPPAEYTWKSGPTPYANEQKRVKSSSEKSQIFIPPASQSGLHLLLFD
ncbi:nectin-1-like [Rhinoderma darwinii]|uniref:nectin-1-like n=1 Tax=Rhinoderma darwinii TaxID=43563 RepID=UPI003F675FA8